MICFLLLKDSESTEQLVPENSYMGRQVLPDKRVSTLIIQRLRKEAIDNINWILCLDVYTWLVIYMIINELMSVLVGMLDKK